MHKTLDLKKQTRCNESSVNTVSYKLTSMQVEHYINTIILKVL